MTGPPAGPIRRPLSPGECLGGSAAAGSFPALALVLALFMVGYVVWAADRLMSVARAAAAVPARDSERPPVASSAAGAAQPPDAADRAGASCATGTRPGHPAGQPVLAPRLAACYKIAMGLAMGYMLILML